MSFDDDFRSNYEAGLEVLGKVGIPAMFFQSFSLPEKVHGADGR